jgi:hypothetical protein
MRKRAPKLVLRAVLIGIALLNLVETALGAPQAAKWLRDAGVGYARPIGIVIAALLAVLFAALAAGPARVEEWRRHLLHGQRPDVDEARPRGVGETDFLAEPLSADDKAASPTSRLTTTAPAIAVYVPDSPCERYRHTEGSDCIYCHLEVAALADEGLRRCHARLILVEQAVAKKWVRDPRFVASVRLKWASVGLDHPEVEYRDIRPGEPALLDVVYTLERSPGRAFIETLDAQSVERSRGLEPSAYLLTVRVIAEDRDPVDYTVLMGVTDLWQAVTMGPYIGPPRSLGAAS